MPELQDGKAPADRSRSVADRVFIVLEALADADTPPTLSELAELTALPMPTIHRLLRFLTTHGYVRQEPSKRYVLGLAMIRFGQSASRGLDSWAAPHLAGLVAKYGETANMAMLEGDSVVYVAQVPSPRAVRMFTEIGHVVMPHCTGVGKAILSMLSDQQVTDLLRRTGMPSHTDHTLTTPEQVLAAMQQVRELGYAVDDGEQEPGVRCVAVPLAGLPFLAAISVSGPSSRVLVEDVARIAPDLLEVAADISRRYKSDGTQKLLQPRHVRHAS
jgi:IclR family acetate operon transcriptional repressor